MLKSDWEKADELAPPGPRDIRAMAAGFAGELDGYNVISGGCANLNVKLRYGGRDAPVLLRVYLRDRDAAEREARIAALAGGKVPVPRLLRQGDWGGKRFALAEFIEGITLRDLILKRGDEDFAPAVREAGRYLAAFSTIKFPNAGFFDAELRPKQAAAPDFPAYARGCLAHGNVLGILGAETCARLSALLEKYRADFPDEGAACLVHGDYDPANMLVRREGGAWRIAAVLDWEFAFAGSPLWDVGNMLRDSHRLPPAYAEAFLSGLSEGGFVLPGNWRRTIGLTNTLSLLHMLERADPATRPRARADMAGLIGHFTAELERGG